MSDRRDDTQEHDMSKLIGEHGKAEDVPVHEVDDNDEVDEAERVGEDER